jgi:hypothetical protein
MLGYDYAANPCGFASVHFGGLAEKPTDSVARLLAADILGRSPGADGPSARRNDAQQQPAAARGE